MYLQAMLECNNVTTHSTHSCTAQTLSKGPPLDPVVTGVVRARVRVRYNFTAVDGTGPSQPRFTRSASINHHKL